MSEKYSITQACLMLVSRLFPNSFQESPKRNQLGDPSTILAENEKIGPPLEEAMKALEINSYVQLCFQSIRINLNLSSNPQYQ